MRRETIRWLDCYLGVAFLIASMARPALAGDVVYFIVPPWIQSGVTLDMVRKGQLTDTSKWLGLELPYSQWEHVSSFDSAADCEEHRRTLLLVSSAGLEGTEDAIQRVAALVTKLSLKQVREMAPQLAVVFPAIWESRCVASSDPRLSR